MSDKTKNFSIIDKGLTVEGTVSCKGQLVIKGTLKGSLEGDTVVIAQDGAAYADAKVASITIGGEFEGQIAATEDIVLLATGKCSGVVTCKNLVVEPGGILNAEVNCKQQQKSGGANAVVRAVK